MIMTSDYDDDDGGGGGDDDSGKYIRSSEVVHRSKYTLNRYPNGRQQIIPPRSTIPTRACL